ncbi:MAG: hypothetical protein K1X55_10220 [Chitinophagales bacterium]|nr:hypothetical protein [Chitinophagales bacterium]
MDTIIYDISTEEYSVYCIYQPTSKDFLSEVFVKVPNAVYYHVMRHEYQPNVATLLLLAKYDGVKSPRPYKAGQPCDGSIGAPVYFLYVKLCAHFSFSAIDLYEEAYSGETITNNDIQSICSFATWQGVEDITEWSDTTITRILESLTEINHHQLRTVVEEHLTRFFNSKKRKMY